MLDDILRAFDAAEHHRRGGPHPDSVGILHDGQPAGRLYLFRAEYLSHPVRKDFRSSPRDRIKAGLPQYNEGLTYRKVSRIRDITYFRRRKAVDVNVEPLFNRGQHFYVIIDVERRV